MSATVKALRWLAVVPVFVATAIIVRFLFDVLFAGGSADMVRDLASSNGFAGHYLLGPIYVLALSMAVSCCAMTAACLMAPTHRHRARMVLTIAFAAFMIIGTLFIAASDRVHYDAEGWIRQALVLIGAWLGTTAAHPIDFTREGVTLWSLLRDDEKRLQ